MHLILNDAGESASQVVTPRAAFERVFGRDRVALRPGLLRHRGAQVRLARSFPGDVEKSTSLDQPSLVSTRTDLIPAAVACARAADVAVVCVGDLAGLFQTGTVGEGSDADSLDLPGVQQQLLESVVATGTPVVVVLTSGRPYNLGGLEDQVAAFVMGLRGRPGGRARPGRRPDRRRGALGSALRLCPERTSGAVPYYYNHKMKSAGTPIARHFGTRYPFGYGRSYTSFELRRPRGGRERGGYGRRDPPAVRRDQHRRQRRAWPCPSSTCATSLASVVRPVKELKAFGRLELGPGERARVAFTVPADMLSFTGLEGRRIVEPGEVELQVGVSSADIRLRATVTLTGETRTLGRGWRMESGCTVER